MRLYTLLLAILLSACANSPKLHTESAKSYIDTINLEGYIDLDLNHQETRSLSDMVEIRALGPWLKQLHQRSFNLQISHLESLQQALLAKQVKSHQQPDLNLVSSATRSKSNELQTHYQTEYQLGAQVSWELDLWNRVGLQSDSAVLDYSMSLAQKESLKRSITARALKQLLTFNWLKDQVDYDQKIESSLNKIKENLRQQWGSGFVPIKEYELAKERALAAFSILEQSKLALGESELLLRQLAQMDEGESLPTWNGQVALPNISVSGKYLLQRPDVHQALLQIKKADIESKVAYRNLFPSFVVNLDASVSSIGNQNLLSRDPLWQLLGQLTAPIFEGGRLRRRITIAQHESHKAYVSYKQILQDAYYEVRSFMIREANLAKQIETQTARLASSQNRFKTNRQGFQKGLVDFVTYAASEISVIEQQKESARLELEHTLNRIDLFLALGLPVSNTDKAYQIASRTAQQHL